MIETVKIGDQEVSVKENPELLKLVESVRKEEKEKLYGEITSLKSNLAALKGKSGKSPEELKELEELKSSLEKAEKAKKEVDGELSELKKANDEFMKKQASGKSEEEKAKEVEALMAALEKTLNDKLKPFEEKLSKIGDVTKEVNVQAKRKDLLEKHKGYIIPELLTGSTVEELENNIKTALETSKHYITVKDKSGKNHTLAEMEELRVKEAKEKEDKEKGGHEKVIIVTGKEGRQYLAPMPPEGDASKKPEELIKGMGEMSLEEFKKNKDTLKRQLMEEMKSEK